MKEEVEIYFQESFYMFKNLLNNKIERTKKESKPGSENAMHN